MQIPVDAGARAPDPPSLISGRQSSDALAVITILLSGDGDQIMMTRPGQVTLIIWAGSVPSVLCIHAANVLISGPGGDQVMRLIISVGPSQPAYISLAPDDLLCLLSTFFMSLQIMIVSVESTQGRHRIISSEFLRWDEQHWSTHPGHLLSADVCEAICTPMSILCSPLVCCECCDPWCRCIQSVSTSALLSPVSPLSGHSAC